MQKFSLVTTPEVSKQDSDRHVIYLLLAVMVIRLKRWPRGWKAPYPALFTLSLYRVIYPVVLFGICNHAANQ